MSYPSKVIANYIIKKSIEIGDRSLNLMKLLKLLYIAQGWSLAILNRKIINEPIDAWKYGPVVANIYHSLKHCGMDSIKELIVSQDVNDEGKIFINVHDCSTIDKEDIALLNNIIEVYKINTGIQLSNWTHENDSPWHKTWFKLGGKERDFMEIPTNEIKEYFIELGEQNESRNRVA